MSKWRTAEWRVGFEMISEQLKERLRKLVEEAHTPQEALIDMIMEVQEHARWLSDEDVEEIARIAGTSPLKIDELATFYNLVFRRPVGQKVIFVCDSISCWTMGSDTIVDYLCRKLRIKMGETTQDGIFTLLPICCLGNCGEAPSMMIGEKMYGNLTPEKIDEILKDESKE